MEILSSCYLFEGLRRSQIACLVSSCREKNDKKGAWLFHEGDAADSLYFVADGSVELLTTIDNDIELPITKLRHSGDCFGTGSLVHPFQHSLSARCAEDVELIFIGRAAIEKASESDKEFGYILMANLAKHYLSRLKETRHELKIHFKILFKAMRY